VPRSQILSKAFNVQHRKDEGLTEFMSHLKDQTRKYAGLYLEDPLGQGMLKFHFVTNSRPDIAKKLQKLENWKNRSIEELLGEAQMVYVMREEEKQKQILCCLLSSRLIGEGQTSTLLDLNCHGLPHRVIRDRNIRG
jgi:hypothetical protein